MKTLDDARFKHVNLKHTDLRKTFARVRREMAEAAEQQKKSVVQPINQRRKA